MKGWAERVLPILHGWLTTHQILGDAVVIPFVGWMPRPIGKPFGTLDGRGVHLTNTSNLKRNSAALQLDFRVCPFREP